MHGKGNNFQLFLCTPTACLLSEDNTIMPIAKLRTHLWLASVWCSVSMHRKGNNFQWFLCIPTACLLSEDDTIMPIADACFLSEAAQCQKYTLRDLVDHVDPKITAAQQAVTIGAFCYPLVGHLREKDTPYNPYKRSLYVLTYKGDSFLFFLTGSAKGVWL